MNNEAWERLKILNAYNKSQEIRHLTLQQEKIDYAKRLNKREDMIKDSLENVRKAPKITFINHLMKFIANKDITEAMIEKEQQFIINYN